MNYPCLVAQLVKNLPATRETWVQSLGWEDSLALGRHGRRVVRVQQAFGRGAPAGGEQQGRSAQLFGFTVMQK